MGRCAVMLASLLVASTGHAGEVEIKSARIPAGAMKNVRQVEFDLTNGNVVRVPWTHDYAQIVATKSARDSIVLDRIRVQVTVLGDRLSIRVGSVVDGIWSNSTDGAVDLVVYVPARLMNIPIPRPPEAPSPAMARAPILAQQ